MTFTEAALEVLRSAGEPLHYKKITEIAIARNLLSHVGKTPEVTMSSRLATLVKKDRGQSPIVKVRPGVFAIRESAMQTDKDPNSISPTQDSESPEPRAETLPVERPRLPGADVFPEEDDDDAPILAGLEESGGEDRGRRRRRRRRRGKGGDVLEGGAPREGARDGNRREAARHDGARHDGARHDAGRHEGDRRDGRRDRDRDRFEGRRDGGRFEGRRQEFERESREPVEIDLSRQPGEGDLLGKDLADAAFAVLSRGERAPHSFARIADLLVRRGRLSGSPDALAPTVAAALRGDAARAQRVHGRPRFRISGHHVSLGEWLLPSEAVRSEENVERGAEHQRDQVRRAFIGRLNDLPAAGFAEIGATWLNAEGVTALRAVRRPGSSGREFHFAGTLRRGAEENRLAIVVLRSGRDLDRDAVVNARGSLHHYGNATGTWLITTGRVAGPAREESAAEGAPPCALFAGSDLARAMERLGIGLRVHFVPLSDIDFDLLESLGDSGQAQGRRQHERERDRDRDRRPRPAERAEEAAAADEDRDEVAEAADDDAVTAEGEGRESGTDFDLLDPELAEASRLSGEAGQWDEVDDEDGDVDAPEQGSEAVASAEDRDFDDEDESDDEPDHDEGERDEGGEPDDDEQDDEDAPEDLSAAAQHDTARKPSGDES
jgi:hypothetical protein